MTPYEAECLVQSLDTISLEQVGDSKWMKQHSTIEKLNMQAHHNALSKHDEFVKDAFVTHEKIPVLIHDLIVVEMWKERVLPHLLEDVDHLAAVKAYIVLYHEATVCNLLEVLLYHSACCEGADDALVELVDFCYRKLTQLHCGTYSVTEEEESLQSDPKYLGTETEEQSLRRKQKEVGFSVAVCSISILRFLTDNIATLPLSVMDRILNGHDFILSLVPLVENPPWTRRRGSKLEKFVDQKWVAVNPRDRFKLTATEGQVWLSIYNLMMDTDCRNKYHYNTHRKSIIVRLRRFFNEVLLDQLPMLAELQRAVEELVIMDPPAPTESTFVVIEQVPEIREGMIERGGFEKIAATQRATVFSGDADSIRREMMELASTYNLDNFDEILDEPVCATPDCGQPATNRCSRCKTEWYCSRACQVQSWKSHKPLCDVVSADAKARGASSSSSKEGAVSTVKAAANNSKTTSEESSSSRTSPLIQVLD